MKRLLSALTILLGLASPLGSQPAPFDMTPEKDAEPQQVIPSSPSLPTPAPAPAPTLTLPIDAVSPAAPALPDRTADGPPRRYLVPVDSLVLAGEVAECSWSVYLTQEQASSAATLNLGYQNAIMVAPETSRLRFLVNNIALVEQPVQSPNGVSEQSVAVLS